MTEIIHTDHDWKPTRPIPVRHAALPPFDPDDPDGLQVHRVPPPELVIPSGPDPLFLRADFNGVTLPGDYVWNGSPATPGSSITMTSGRWTGLVIPFLAGANSTPPTMIMTPMLPLYPVDVIESVLTEHAERFYTHIIWDPEPWNAAQNGRGFGVADAVTFGKTLKDRGFYSFAWKGHCCLGDPYLKALVEADAVDVFGIGEEVDSKMRSEDYEAIVQNNLAIASGVPCGAHFTCDEYVPGDPGRAGRCYPLSFPRDTFINDWSKYDGKLHLMLQSCVDLPAGAQSSFAYYARQHVNAGIGDAARGPGAPNSRVWAFENMATAELYGRCTEEYACLRALEMLYATRNDSRVRPMAGSGNGLRLPNGDPA